MRLVDRRFDEDRTSSSIARRTAVPIDPDELSTSSRAGEMRSMNATAPSPASTGSRRRTCLISDTASFTRCTASRDSATRRHAGETET